MEKFREFTRALFYRVQRVLVPAMLFFVYYFIVGPTALAARLFGLLPGRPAPGGSYWLPSRPGPAGPEEASEQS